MVVEVVIAAQGFMEARRLHQPGPRVVGQYVKVGQIAVEGAAQHQLDDAQPLGARSGRRSVLRRSIAAARSRRAVAT